MKKKFLEKTRFSIEFRASRGKQGFLRGIAMFITKGKYSERIRTVSFRYKEGVSISVDIVVPTTKGELQCPLFQILDHPISAPVKESDIFRPDLASTAIEISSALRGGLEKILSLDESRQPRVLCKGVRKYFLLAKFDDSDDGRRLNFSVDENAWSRLFAEVSSKPFDNWSVPRSYGPWGSEWECSGS